MNYNDYYQEKLLQGNKFEDFVVDILLKEYGIIVQPYSSREYQYERGENRQGIEIKRDNRFRETGNFYIETHEKRPGANKWVLSGIYRGDSRFYIIGDENLFYFFAIKHLLSVEKDCRTAEIQTSRGFLLPAEIADKLCCFCYDTSSW